MTADGSGPLSHVRVPIAAIDACTDRADLAAVLWLYRCADEARWAPFRMTSRDFRGGVLSGRSAARLLAALESAGLLAFVDRGCGNRAAVVVVRNPTDGTMHGAECSADADPEHSRSNGGAMAEQRSAVATAAIDESGTKAEHSRSETGAPARARGNSLQPPASKGRDPSIVGDPPITVEQSSTPDPAPAEPQQEPPEPKAPHWTADLWAQLQAIRSEHLPGARGQGLTTKRKTNLMSRTRELRQAGLSRDDLLRAARWVHESANIRAEGARSTGDPLGVLLRPAHCVEYCELAEAEERQGDAVVHRASAAGGPSNSQPETPPTLEQPGDDPRWGQWGLDARERESLRYTLGNIEHARSRGDLTTERKIQSYYDQKMTTLERQHATPAPVLRLVDGGQA